MALSKVWVFAEADSPGKPTSLTLELLTKAREMAGTVEAFYAGADPDGLAGPLGEFGAATVYALDTGDSLIGAPAAAALAELIGEHQPDAVVFGASYDGRDVCGRLSARLDLPVLSNGMTWEVDARAMLSRRARHSDSSARSRRSSAREAPTASRGVCGTGPPGRSTRRWPAPGSATTSG